MLDESSSMPEIRSSGPADQLLASDVHQRRDDRNGAADEGRAVAHIAQHPLRQHGGTVRYVSLRRDDLAARFPGLLDALEADAPAAAMPAQLEQ
jgi:hypothetical protein